MRHSSALRHGLTFDLLVHPFFSTRYAGDFNQMNARLYFALWRKRISFLATQSDRGLILISNYGPMQLGKPGENDYVASNLNRRLVSFADSKLGKERLLVIRDEFEYPQRSSDLGKNFRLLLEHSFPKGVVIGKKLGKVYGELRSDCVKSAKVAFENFSGQNLIISPSLVVGGFFDKKSRRRRLTDVVSHHKKVVNRARRIFAKRRQLN